MADSRTRGVFSRLLPVKPHSSANVDGTDSHVDGPHGQQTATSYKEGDVRVITTSQDESSNTWSHQPSAVLWKGSAFYTLSWDLLGVVLSLCFLVLGACVAALKDKPESHWSNRVVQATKIAPSIWPIIFSGIVGNAIRALADWKVENGVELLTLEQLLGSLTMAGSVITMFRWSIFRILSAILIFLWAFNPIGSQASFRGISLQTSAGISEGHISYYNASINVQFGLSTFCCSSTRSKPTIRALYSATLYDFVSSTQYVNIQNDTAKEIIAVLGGEGSAAIQAATDNWGNVRIPNLDSLPNYDEKNPHGWVETPWDKKILNYSSLLGERVEGVDRTMVGNTSFMIESSYQQFSCVPWFSLNNTSSATVAESNRSTSELDDWLKQKTGLNYTQQFKGADRRRSRTFFVSPLLRNMTTEPGVPELVFASRGDDLTEEHLTLCTARTVYVDAKVTCISRGSLGKANCGVTALRQTAQPRADPLMTVLHQNAHISNSFMYFMDMLEDEFGGGSGISSPTEEYLYDPLTAFSKRGDTIGYTELSRLDIATFERRFGLMWNTLWKISWAQRSAMGGKLYGSRDPNVEKVVLTPQAVLNTTSVVTYPLPPVYKIDRAWLTVYFISVGMMLAAALFALVVHSRCRAPALLGYVSSLVRDSPYFQENGVHRNSADDGSTTTRKLGNIKVMVGDVRGKDEAAGKIAFAPVEMGRRVEKGRWYD